MRHRSLYHTHETRGRQQRSGDFERTRCGGEHSELPYPEELVHVETDVKVRQGGVQDTEVCVIDVLEDEGGSARVRIPGHVEHRDDIDAPADILPGIETPPSRVHMQNTTAWIGNRFGAHHGPHRAGRKTQDKYTKETPMLYLKDLDFTFDLALANRLQDLDDAFLPVAYIHALKNLTVLSSTNFPHDLIVLLVPAPCNTNHPRDRNTSGEYPHRRM